MEASAPCVPGLPLFCVHDLQNAVLQQRVRQHLLQLTVLLFQLLESSGIRDLHYPKLTCTRFCYRRSSQNNLEGGPQAADRPLGNGQLFGQWATGVPSDAFSPLKLLVHGSGAR